MTLFLLTRDPTPAEEPQSLLDHQGIPSTCSFKSYTYFLHLHTVFPGRVTSPILKMRKENWGSGKVNCNTESAGYCLPVSCAEDLSPRASPPASLLQSQGCVYIRLRSSSFSADGLFISGNLVTQLTGSNMADWMRALQREGNNNILDLYVRKTYLTEGHRY